MERRKQCNNKTVRKTTGKKFYVFGGEYLQAVLFEGGLIYFNNYKNVKKKKKKSM